MTQLSFFPSLFSLCFVAVELEPPTNLRVRRIRATKTTLKWTPPEFTDFDFYRVAIKKKRLSGWPGSWSFKADVIVGATSKKVTNLKPSKNDRLKIRSFDGQDGSAWSEYITFTTKPA